jgi:transposase
LLKLLAELDRHVAELDEAVRREADQHPQARLMMTQPGVGPVTSLAFVLTIGDVNRFRHSGQVASYVGLIPREHSSGGKQRLGAISKQGNRFMRASCWWRPHKRQTGWTRDFAGSIRRAAITSRRAWPRWRRPGS